MTLPGTAAIPAVHADRLRAAEATGARAVELIGSELTPDQIITAKSVENALRVLLAIGGSTNAIVHLTAIAGRAGVKIARAPQRAFRYHAGAGRPQADRQPLHGGFLRRRRHRRGDARAEAAAASRLHDRHRRDARRASRSRRPTPGSTAPIIAAREHRSSRRAAWLPCSARSRRTARSSSARPRIPSCSSTKAGRWCSPRSTTSRRASTIPQLDVTPMTSWCCRTPARNRASAMPEAGYLPIPKKLARAGVKDMVRISDARMSGTAYGTIVLHVTPDAASGGPLGARAQRRPHPPLRQGAAHRSARRRRRVQAARRCGEARGRNAAARLRPVVRAGNPRG